MTVASLSQDNLSIFFAVIDEGFATSCLAKLGPQRLMP
jgi:hypothetical protein